MMRYQKNDNAGLPVLAAIVAIVVVMALVCAFVIWPYFTRAESYANDPTDPPDDVEKGEDPKWQGKFLIKYEFDWYSFGGAENTKIREGSMDLQDYDGQPWDTSFSTGSFFKPESTNVKYTLKLTKGNTVLKDEGTWKAYGPDFSNEKGETRWFFFWEEQEGNWVMDLTLKIDGQTWDFSGTAGLSGGKMIVNI